MKTKKEKTRDQLIEEAFGSVKKKIGPFKRDRKDRQI
jgi:hypothetical protein